MLRRAHLRGVRTPRSRSRCSPRNLRTHAHHEHMLRVGTSVVPTPLAAVPCCCFSQLSRAQKSRRLCFSGRETCFALALDTRPVHRFQASPHTPAGSLISASANLLL
mgnify:FL=1